MPFDEAQLVNEKKTSLFSFQPVNKRRGDGGSQAASVVKDTRIRPLETMKVEGFSEKLSGDRSGVIAEANC